MAVPTQIEVTALDGTSAVAGTTPLVNIQKTLRNIRVGMIYDNNQQTAEYAYMICAKEFPSFPKDPPTAPANLSGTPDQNSVLLKWTDTSDLETRFEVRRNNTLIATLEQNVTVFSDVGLAPETSYDYTVTAVGEGGASPAAAISVKTDSKPTNGVRKPIPAGTDLSKLKADKYSATGTFALPKSFQSGVDIEGPFTLEAAAGVMLQANGSTDVRLSKVTFDGKGVGGNAGSDNANAMVQTGDRWIIEDFTLTSAAGYGLSIFKCSGVILRKGTLKNCGSGGLGGVSTKGGLIEDLIIEGNNTAHGADSNKFTRMESLTARRCIWRGNFGKGLWLDYGNSNFTAEDCEFSGNRDIYKGDGSLKDAGDGVFFEISGAMPKSKGSQEIKFEGPNVLRNCKGFNNRLDISQGEANKSRRNSGNSRSSCHTHIDGGSFDVFAFSGGEGKRTEPSDGRGDLKIFNGAKIDVLVFDNGFGDVRKKNLLTIDPSAAISQKVSF